MLDLLVHDVRIVDGTAGKAFRGDIAVRDGWIAEVRPGRIDRPARQTVEAQGLTAVPGFVDIHRHGDLTPFSPPRFEELRQGITTFVCGNCGFSAAPSTSEHFALLRDYARPILGEIPPALAGLSYREFLRRADRALGSNTGYLVGGGALRTAVKGFDPSPLRAGELDRLRGLLREALAAGALGLSMGLMYVPENFCDTRELVALCQVAAGFGRPVAVHMRGEGRGLLASIGEVIRLARESGAAMHISHLKAAGRAGWRSLIPRALEKIAGAQAMGLDLSFDVYPYRAGSTALYTLLPPAVQEGGVAAMLERLRDPVVRRRTVQALAREGEGWDNLIPSTGWESVVLAGGADPALVGNSILDISQNRNCSPADCTIDLLLEQGGDLPIVFRSMCEEDVLEVLRAPGAIVVSDALYSAGGLPHPRRYGTHARLLGRYAQAIGLERAVRSVTALPAERMGLAGRGLLREGCAADLLLLDMDSLRDTATYENPVRYPEGIRLVVLGGHVALEGDGEPAGCFGRLLRAGDGMSGRIAHPPGGRNEVFAR